MYTLMLIIHQEWTGPWAMNGEPILYALFLLVATVMGQHVRTLILVCLLVMVQTQHAINAVIAAFQLIQQCFVNSSVSIAAETGILVYSISYKIYSIGSNGIRSSTAIATGTTVHNTNSISGSYRFTQAGLYEVEFSIIDCSTERNTITNSMRIRIQ